MIGVHNNENCQESEGCMEVQIIKFWSHEYHRIGGRFDNDIALVKLSSQCFFLCSCVIWLFGLAFIFLSLMSSYCCLSVCLPVCSNKDCR